MARSIHTTRRHLHEHLSWGRADADAKRRLTEQLEEELRHKRAIKRQVQDERRAAPRPDPVVELDAIPIEILDQGPYVHPGATLADVRAVCARLPPGTVDGLAAIRIGLGSEIQEERAHGDDPDPHTGRLSFEYLPGVYAGLVLGVYYPHCAEIFLCAWVYDRDALVHPRVVEMLLKLSSLATLCHEIGHHHDHAARTARGRWLADTEVHAESSEHHGTRDVVIPYLEDTYPDEVAHLEAWLREHGGIELSLEQLVDDPRTPKFFTMHGALNQLLKDVAAGLDPIERQVEFARQLHYRDEYQLPRQVLAAVFATHPDHLDGQTLLADIEVHEGQLDSAETRSRAVLERAPDHLGAWNVLLDVLELGHRWAEVPEAVREALKRSEPDSWNALWLVRLRARAHLELGDHPALEDDLRLLELGSKARQRDAVTLRALMLLRQRRLTEALELASTASGKDGAPVEVRAVRFDAAHQLGRPEDAGALTPRDLESLRRLGHQAWVARLSVVTGWHESAPS